jgi:arsenate reductase (thioredoxin)
VIKFRGKSEEPAERTILFVCVENAGRSQMAEGFFNRKYSQKATGQSALGLDWFPRLTLSRFRL